MLRRLLAIYLVLTTVAGPGLCCCSFTRLFANNADRPVVRDAPPPCCHAPSGDEDQQNRDGCPHDKGDPRNGGCPCRQDAPKDALVGQAVAMPDQFQSGHFPFAPFLTDASGDGSTLNGVAAPPGDPPPFLTVQDLLHLRQRLRC